MSQLIDFKDFNPKEKLRTLPEVSQEIAESSLPDISDLENNLEYKLTLNILVHDHPGKLLFSMKETADKLGTGEDFIRRRIKSGKIKVVYLGDKPFINTVELARIITQGV